MRNAILLSLLAAIAIAGFTRLALWQLDRAEEKRAIIAAYEDAAEHPLEIAFGDPSDAGGLRYARVSGTGLLDSSRQLLLDNMVVDGVVGYRVLTPFMVWFEDGPRWILVDRGWIPHDWEAQGVTLGLLGMPRTIHGRLDTLPRPAVEMSYPEPDPTAPYPRVVSFPTTADAAAELDGMPLPWALVRLDEGEPACFRCGFHPVSFPPERHLGYALQWAALALTVLLAWVVLGYRTWRRARDGG